MILNNISRELDSYVNFTFCFNQTTIHAKVLLFCFTFFCWTLQVKKDSFAQSTTESIIVDGLINEQAWITDSILPLISSCLSLITGTDQYQQETEVKVLYDNEAIYISAMLYDNEPNKIQKEITNRDVFGVSDHFSVSINGFNDGQQDFRFFVSAANIQMDCLQKERRFSWDAIWESKATITDFGWVVEMKIPYAALRFSNAKKNLGIELYA
jgi:hypothetical protein